MKIKTEFTDALLLETRFSNLLSCKNKAKPMPMNFMHHFSIHQIFNNSKLFTINTYNQSPHRVFWKIIVNYSIIANCGLY